MQQRQVERQQVPLDFSVPSVARMCNYLLGGKDNFEVDRERAEEAIVADHLMPDILIENRRFMQRVVRYLLDECGITQFIDIGMGLPMADNVHQVAQRNGSESRVVYVDNDPIVVAHGQALLAENGYTAVIKADLRDPETILQHLDLLQLIDLSRPVAILLMGVLHFIPDKNEPEGIMARLRATMAPGSYLAISHACADARPMQVGRVMEVYQHTASPSTARGHEQIRALFGDFHLDDPGLVWVPAWRPEKPASPVPAEHTWFLGGVARRAATSGRQSRG